MLFLYLDTNLHINIAAIENLDAIELGRKVSEKYGPV